jgi:hypothetical protein
MLAQARQAQEVSMSNPPEVDPEEARRRQKIQRQLDEADPVSIVTSNEEEDWGDEPAKPPAVPTQKPDSGH